MLTLSAGLLACLLASFALRRSPERTACEAVRQLASANPSMAVY